MSDIPSQIKRQAMDRDFQPSVRIGKTGITENIVEEIRGQLKKRKLVKIKINKGIYDRDARSQVWEYLAEETLRLRRRLSPYRMRVTFQPGRMRATLGEHLEILKAISQGNSQKAKDAAKSHLRLIGSVLEDFIASVSSTLKN